MNELEIYLLLIVLIVPIFAYARVRINYTKYKAILLSNKMSGFEVARKILDENDLPDIHIVEIKGEMTDHYDSSRKVLRLSTHTFHSESITAAAIAAHECGHALQDSTNYSFFRIRTMLFPIVNLCSKVAYGLIIASVLLSVLNLFYIGIGLMLFSIIFQLVTLPVEYNATARAEEQLLKLEIVTMQEVMGVKSMLSAAVFTYVANTLASLLQILRLFLSSRD